MDESLDYEWIELIMEAKNLGVTKEDIRNFIQRKWCFLIK